MWAVLILKFLLIWIRVAYAEESQTTTMPPEVEAAVGKFGTNLVTQLRNDANLDLSADEEYEDLRAELLAYHTALAKLSDSPSRRSMVTTACWQLGGICVNFKLCSGFRYLTEVPGCKDHHNVCCFTWNQYRVKDMRDHGIGGPFPWSIQYTYGGQGIESAPERSEEVKEPRKKKKKHKLKKEEELINNVDKENDNGALANDDVVEINLKQTLKDLSPGHISKKIPSKPKSRLRNINENDERSYEDLVPPQRKKKKIGYDSTETLALILKGI